MTLFKAAPNIVFSHGGSTKKKNILDFRRIIRKKRIMLLVRDPRDVLVSLFHDYANRYNGYKGTSSEFTREDFALDRIIDFMNLWAEEIGNRKRKILLVRYEDMKKNTKKEFIRILNFLNIQTNKKVIDKAVNFSSFKNMRRMELEGLIKDPRLKPTNIKDVNSYKTRKGEVGNYKEELSKEDINYINKRIKEKLNPLFGY